LNHINLDQVILDIGKIESLIMTDNSNFRKVKYDQEDDIGISGNLMYFFAIFLPVPIVCMIMGIIYSMPALMIPGIVIVCISVVILLFSVRGREISAFSQMRKRYTTNGIRFVGTVVEVVSCQSTKVVKTHTRPVTKYAYKVRYINGENEVKTIETNLVRTARRGVVGKKCIVYECEGKCIVDAIEK